MDPLLHALRWGVLANLMMLCGPVAAAGVEFSGTVSGLSGDSVVAVPLIPSVGFGVGAPIAGRVEWIESGVADTNPAIDEGLYPGALLTFQVEIGGQNWAAGEGDVAVIAGAMDPIQLTGRSIAGPGYGSLLPSIFIIDFEDPTDFIQSDALPTVDPPFADRILPGTLSLNFTDSATGFLEIEATVSSYAVVPEPGSAVLIGLGLPLLALARRRAARLDG